MTRITHFKQQPINIHYWDYYILCRLNAAATIALQRMEYWDGTKEDGNAHAEDINEVLEHQGQAPTQDTDRWVYKAMDELQWELMGVTGEKKLPKLIDFLVDELHYLERRNNPLNTWDRKKQYGLNAAAIQDHINYLGYIISYFKLPFRRLTPVFYAIEVLTREGVYIDRLNVDRVYAKIESFKEGSKIPHFLKNEIEKFFQTFLKPAIRPFRTFAEWKAQSCGMHPAKVRNGKRKNAESIPQKRGSNSIEYKTENTNIDHKHNEEREVSETVSPSIASETSVSSPAHHLLPTKNQNETQDASYRPNEEDHERHPNNPLAHSIPTHPTPDRAMPDEQQSEVDPLHVAPYQDTPTGAEQTITPTSGETAQAQQLELPPSRSGGNDTPTLAGETMTPPEPESPAQPAPATKGGRKGSAKGDATPTGVGGKKQANRGKKQGDGEKKESTSRKRPVIELTEEQEQRWRYWRDYIYERRGGGLRDAWEVVQETEAFKLLVKEFSDEQIHAIYQDMTTEWPYKNNPAKIGGKDLLKESRPTWQKLKNRVQPRGGANAGTSSNTYTGRQISSFDNPDYDMSDEFYPSEAEKQARRETAHAASYQ